MTTRLIFRGGPLDRQHHNAPIPSSLLHTELRLQAAPGGCYLLIPTTKMQCIAEWSEDDQ